MALVEENEGEGSISLKLSYGDPLTVRCGYGRSLRIGQGWMQHQDSSITNATCSRILWTYGKLAGRRDSGHMNVYPQNEINYNRITHNNMWLGLWALPNLHFPITPTWRLWLGTIQNLQRRMNGVVVNYRRLNLLWDCWLSLVMSLDTFPATIFSCGIPAV